MEYKKLVEIYEKLEATTKRLEKTYYISKLLADTPKDDLEHITLLIEGRVFPHWDTRKIGVASRLVLKALNLASGISVEKIENDLKKTGDLGNTAQNLISKKIQATLFTRNLTVEKVFNNLKKLATLEGIGSVDRKIKLIAELLTSAKPVEGKYIVRTILEELRVGVAAGTLRDAIAWAFFPKIAGIFFKCGKCKSWLPLVNKCLECGNILNLKFNKEIEKFKEKNVLEIGDISELKDLKKYDFILAKNEKVARETYNYFVELVQKAVDITNDFAVVAKIAKEKGRGGLLGVNLIPGKPLKVMLAQKVSSMSEGFDRVKTPCAIEHKYDGFRMQIHKFDNKIRIFTRRLEDVTKQFPEVVDYIKKHVKGKSFIIDSEAVGYNAKTKKYLPFQNISQRIKRKYDIDKMAKELPVELNVFDIIYLDGENFIEKPFKKRREAIKKIVKPESKKIILAKELITSNKKEAEKFYKQSLDYGHEGVMLKALDAPYKPGSRVGHMVKLKPGREMLDLVVVGAEWGKGKRKGWLSSFRIACLDEDTGEFLEVGKVGTGIKELEGEGVTFEKLTDVLKPLITEEKGVQVKIKPEIILEINYEEIQKSPTYTSGYALRFPRVIRIRDDKAPDEASTLQMVEEFYYEQKK